MAADSDSEKTLLAGRLRQASELEHGLCCQYLFAAFSLKAGGDPDLTPSQVARALQWDQQITRVAVQEMSHLMMVSNLLTAIGEEPHLWRPQFPQPTSHYSRIDVPSILAPLDLETASRFVCWEQPETDGWWIAWCTAPTRPGSLMRGLSPATPPDQPAPYKTIGGLYELIRQALYDHQDWISPDSVPRQVTSRLVPFTPKVPAIKDYGTAASCIEMIIEQGEGAPDWESNSHFAYFHQIVDELKGAEASFVPAWVTVDNPIYVPDSFIDGANYIDLPGTRAIGLLFNDLYLLLLQMLWRLFVPEDDTQESRVALANAAMALMPLGIKPIGTLLTRLSAGGSYRGRCAGPSFELPASVAIPADRRQDGWKFLRERMANITRRCRLITLEPPADIPAPAVATLVVVSKDLETLMPLFEREAAIAR